MQTLALDALRADHDYFHAVAYARRHPSAKSELAVELARALRELAHAEAAASRWTRH